MKVDKSSNANENEQLQLEAQRAEEKLNELIMTEDNIEIAHHLENCADCQNDPASVLSLIGCNIYGEHFEEEAPIQNM